MMMKIQRPTAARLIASLHHPGVAFRQACEFCLELPEKPVFLSVLGFQPDAHGVVGTAHDRRFAGAGNALDGVENEIGRAHV